MYYYGRIVGIDIYENDVVVKRQGEAPNADVVPRGVVTEFTKASRRRLAFVASNTAVEFRTMLCLTYPREFPTDGKQVKKHLLAFLKWLRRDTGGIEYLWFLEFQRRGAPHIHILIDWPWPRTRIEERDFRFRVISTWYRICDTGDVRHLQAGTSAEKLRSSRGGAFYAIKYAMKMRQKAVPEGYRNCGRFWGHSHGVKPQKQATYRCTEDDIRGVLEGWDYAPSERQHVHRTLFNTANRFTDHIVG